MNEQSFAVIKATIFFEKRFWVGLFEREDKAGYAVAKHIFGAEPSDPEIYEFVLKNYRELRFGEPKEFKLKVKRMNPKRVQREVRREMERIKETMRPCTYAEDYMRQEIEKGKEERQHKSVIEKQEDKDKQFELRQIKKKKKHRGH
jgi:hypothetical protein